MSGGGRGLGRGVWLGSRVCQFLMGLEPCILPGHLVDIVIFRDIRLPRSISEFPKL